MVVGCNNFKERADMKNNYVA